MLSSSQQRTTLAGIRERAFGTFTILFMTLLEHFSTGGSSNPTRVLHWSQSDAGAHRSWEDLWSHSKREGKKKKIANHECIWLTDVREKPQTQEQICTAQQGRKGGVQETRERSGRMKENHFPTRERQKTHRPTTYSQQQWRDEIKKGAITTVFFLYPFFLF